MSRPAESSGQASPEYVSLIVLAALAMAALSAWEPVRVGLGETIAGALASAAATPGGDPHHAAPAPSPPPAPPVDPQALVDDLMAGELGTFLAYRSSRERDPRLDYSTDECSAPVIGSRGRSFDFTEACLRHDFGYRNYERLGLLRERRRAVDGRFLADMRAHCLTRASHQLISCLEWARTFHLVVRAFGGIGRG